MNRLIKVSLLITVCLVGSAGALFFWLNQPVPPERQRVIGMPPPVVGRSILAVKNHIIQTPRPIETYSFPIPLGGVGPVVPLYAGDNQYPFYCNTVRMGLGQPLVDNKQGYGAAVYQDNDEIGPIIGYSKDCLIPAQLKYYVLRSSGKSLLYTGGALNDDDQLIRVEHGVINRFIYSMIMPIERADLGDRASSNLWNKKLIYHFGGGSGIGFRQGRQKMDKLMQIYQQEFKEGYSLITSTGNRTSYTYNIFLSEDTARRVKKHFVSIFGEPEYTVGIGGSGGALSQYLMAQNVDDLLDAIIPLYSYPDMVSQSLYALDCDLLNNYYQFRSKDKLLWRDYDYRQSVEGLNSLNGKEQKYGFLQTVNQVYSGGFPFFPKGNSECINGWFGISSYLNNPKQGFLKNMFSKQIQNKTHWSYWEDMVQIYGRDDTGFARSTYDNDGVQYGLRALREGVLSVDDFVDINKKVGGWVSQQRMQAEQIWAPLGRKLALWLSLWSRQNIFQTVQGIAPRSIGDDLAIEAAYRYGQIFIGKVDIPVLDVRHYLEDELDMHHASASFSSRLRISDAMGHSDNHVVWVSHHDDQPIHRAFKAMDQWLAHRKKGLTDRPDNIADSCFDQNGAVVHQGDRVWDGPWNQQPNGQCMNEFPIFSNSRIQAGAQWRGALFKCHHMSVDSAIAQGVYVSHNMAPYVGVLQQIFPSGVCDYTKGDKAMPTNL